jgi:peptidoglycan/LPS O-acetylase OafA/YrhL
VLENRWVRLLGEASFAIYILQWISWNIFYTAFPEAPRPWLLVALTVLGTILMAIVSHRFFETPMRHWLRGTRPAAAEPMPGIKWDRVANLRQEH